ncbi:MAG: hypothetical protein H6587_02220 [Flavobacteriales bacterium]|nr:hypothetical protein [Flavobacteriales bacterium]MCB9363361.1 hypothetical protein [Flavobacteriales bacterium]
MRYTFLIIIILFLFGCQPQNRRIENTTNRTKDPNAKYTTCVLIEKYFINKGGKKGDFTELYLQCSVQDYFIKICAGEVTEKELLKYLNQEITVDVEIKEGRWDYCSNDLSNAQSRVGVFAVIHKIIE